MSGVTPAPHRREPVPVIVALGSNQGDSTDLLRRAGARLAALLAGPFRLSSLWLSDPVDCPPGSPDFVNAVAVTGLPEPVDARELLGRLQALEREFGRRPKRQANEPRPLDLDLIAVGAQVCQTTTLILPHPRAAQRRFVLAPLAELLPAFRAPGWPGTAAELLAALPAAPAVRRWAGRAGPAVGNPGAPGGDSG